MTLDSLNEGLLVAAVGTLLSSGVGYAIVAGLKRLGLRGQVRLRASAWAVCSIIVAAVYTVATHGTWSGGTLLAIAMLGAQAATGAHAIREAQRPTGG